MKRSDLKYLGKKYYIGKTLPFLLEDKKGNSVYCKDCGNIANGVTQGKYLGIAYRIPRCSLHLLIEQTKIPDEVIKNSFQPPAPDNDNTWKMEETVTNRKTLKLYIIIILGLVTTISSAFLVAKYPIALNYLFGIGIFLYIISTIGKINP